MIDFHAVFSDYSDQFTDWEGVNMGGIAEPLERVLILIPVGVLANDEVPDCDSSVRSTDACHLPNDPTGAFDVMEANRQTTTSNESGGHGMSSASLLTKSTFSVSRFRCVFRAISSGARQIYSDHRLTAIGEAERHVTGAGSDLEYAVARRRQLLQPGERFAPDRSPTRSPRMHQPVS